MQNSSNRRGFGTTSLLAYPSSSNSDLGNVKVVRLDIDKLTNGNVQSRNILTRLLDSIVSGNEVNFTSPIANDNNPSDILSGWDEVYNDNLSKINNVLDKIEMSNRSKYGPRSIAKPWSERKEKLYSSFGRGGTYPQLDVVKLGPTKRLRALTVDNAMKYLKNNTNSGLPFMVKKGRVKEETLRWFKDLLAVNSPCVLFTRTQEGGKTRDVWGYPIADTLNEMRFYRPLLELQSKNPSRAALRNPRSLDEAINKLMRFSRQNNLYNFSSDVSGYDDDAKLFVQSIARDSIKPLFQSEFADEIDVCFDRFNTKGIVTPDGILTGPHGIPSGSTFTNEVGSIIQLSVLNSARRVYTDLCQVQGDDGVVPTSDPDEVFSAFELAGFKINEEKSDVSREYLVYLQLLYHPDYFDHSTGLISGVYSTYRALNRIVHMERFDDISEEGISGKDYFAIRTISILENCKHHPLFRELVRYVHSLDKYSLATSDLGIRAYVELRRKQEGKDVSFTQYNYGDDIAGIKNFETYKLIAEFNR